MMPWMLIFVAGAMCLVEAPAVACSLLLNEPHAIDPDAGILDTDPPAAPQNMRVEHIKRGIGPDVGGATTSCDSTGTLTISFDPAHDARTKPVDMGYELTLVRGSAPLGLLLPSGAVRQLDGGNERAKVLLVWDDEATDTQEAIAFTLRVVAVDRAGLRAPPVSLGVSHPGFTDGCHAPPRSDAGGHAPVFLLMLLALSLRRRRHRPRPPPAALQGPPRGC